MATSVTHVDPNPSSALTQPQSHDGPLSPRGPTKRTFEANFTMTSHKGNLSLLMGDTSHLPNSYRLLGS